MPTNRNQPLRAGRASRAWPRREAAAAGCVGHRHVVAGRRFANAPIPDPLNRRKNPPGEWGVALAVTCCGVIGKPGLCPAGQRPQETAQASC
jgi:hypothetical protein